MAACGLPRLDSCTRAVLPQCSIPMCVAYSSECSCSSCGTGYRASNGRCVEVRCGLGCAGHQCLQAVTGYHRGHVKNVQLQCGVSNCQSYSANGECSCGTCASGYRVSDNSCLAVRTCSLCMASACCAASSLLCMAHKLPPPACCSVPCPIVCPMRQATTVPA